MVARIITKRYLACPGCGESSYYMEHLLDRAPHEFGPWGCDAAPCLTEIFGKVTAEGEVHITETRTRAQRGYALLKFRDLYLILDERYGRVEREHADYLYHSHQCTTNLLRRISAVICPAQGEDPHGVLRFVANIAATPEITARVGEHADMSLAAIFALFKTDGTPIASAYPEENRGVMAWLAELQRHYRNAGEA